MEDDQKIMMLHVFDVDGTLTHHDSLMLLLRFACPSFGRKLLLWGSVLPIAFYATILGKPEMVKLALLKKLWWGKTQQAIASTGVHFFNEKMKIDLRQKAIIFIKNQRKKNPSQKLVLLSASCKEWLQPLADFLQADLICTELEYDARNKFTGHFATPNCKGVEKVRRLLERYPANQYEFICYADSPSDKHLQTISRQFFYRYF